MYKYFRHVIIILIIKYIHTNIADFSSESISRNHDINENDVERRTNGVGRASKGVGVDSLDKIVIEIFKNEMKIFLANFFNKIFQTTYPDIWREQLLRPEIKKGHTELKPKLRGIAITQLLPSMD